MAIQYTQSEGVSLGYIVSGEGDLTTIYVPGAFSNLAIERYIPESVAWEQFLRRFGRLITFDKRATGVSDRSARPLNLDQQVVDVEAIRIATDSKDLIVCGLSQGSVHGAINMLGLAKRLRCKIFQASTSEVYGDPKIHPQTEDYWGHVNPIGARSCYDEGKRCAETLFFDYRRQHKLGIKVARIFNTYGPRMHPNDGRVVSNFILQALRDEPITIYGDGSQTRSFCYVDDLIDGFLRLMETEAHVTGPTNLGNPHEFTIRELAEKVIAMTGSRSQVTFEPLPADDPKQRQPDISVAREMLDWQPTIPLDEGLKRTIGYFRNLLKEDQA